MNKDLLDINEILTEASYLVYYWTFHRFCSPSTFICGILSMALNVLLVTSRKGGFFRLLTAFPVQTLLAMFSFLLEGNPVIASDGINAS